MAAPSALAILQLVVLLQLKHAVVDGPLQKPWMVVQKGFYGRSGGIIHAGLHGIGSLGALLVFGTAGMLCLQLAIADALLHYHIDFAKEHTVKRLKWSASHPYFWWALTADQMAHQFTYSGIAAVVAMSG